MGAQGVQDLPDNAIPLVVVQRLVGINTGWNAHWQNHVSLFLVGCLAHDPANRLHDINLAVARMQEHDGVERRHIDTFGQAAGVAEDTADILAGVLLQPVETLPPFSRVVCAVHMPDLAGCALLPAFIACPLELVYDLFKLVANEFGAFDAAAESKCPAHRLGAIPRLPIQTDFG